MIRRTVAVIGSDIQTFITALSLTLHSDVEVHLIMTPVEHELKDQLVLLTRDTLKHLKAFDLIGGSELRWRSIYQGNSCTQLELLTARRYLRTSVTSPQPEYDPDIVIRSDILQREIRDRFRIEGTLHQVEELPLVTRLQSDSKSFSVVFKEKDKSPLHADWICVGDSRVAARLFLPEVETALNEFYVRVLLFDKRIMTSEYDTTFDGCLRHETLTEARSKIIDMTVQVPAHLVKRHVQAEIDAFVQTKIKSRFPRAMILHQSDVQQVTERRIRHCGVLGNVVIFGSARRHNSLVDDLNAFLQIELQAMQDLIACRVSNFGFSRRLRARYRFRFQAVARSWWSRLFNRTAFK